MTHGTHGGYCNGCRCDDCRAAHTTYARELRRSAEAEVILDRTADRLAGYTHEEVAEMHPLPEVKPR